MKKINIILYVLIILFYGCTKNSNNVKDYLEQNTTIIQISVYAVVGDSIQKDFLVLQFESQEDISKILNFISNQKSPFYKCGYTGTISFFSGDKSILDAKFNHNPDCNHIVYVYKEKMQSFRLSDDAIEFINEKIIFRLYD